MSQGDVAGLGAFGALLDIEFNALALFQVAVPIALDGGEMDEDVRAALAGDEAVALAGIEPFDRADDTFRDLCDSLWI